MEQTVVFEPIVQQHSDLETNLYASPRRSVEEEEEESKYFLNIDLISKFSSLNPVYSSKIVRFTSLLE